MSKAETLNKEVELTSKEEVESPDSAKLDISPEVQEIMTDKTKETAASLSPENRKFLGKLFENIKSSEIVKNIVDRHEVHKNEKLEQRADDKIGQLRGEQGMENKGIEDLRSAQNKEEDRVKEIKEVYKSMDKEPNQEEIAKLRAEAVSRQALLDKKEEAVQIIECKITDMEEKLGDYKNKVETTRGRLDGRLEVKIELNNSAIQEFSNERTDINKNIENNQTQIKELDNHANKLNNLLREGDKGAVAEMAKKTLKEIQERRKKLSNQIEDLESNRNKLDKKISGLDKKNSDLQTKRDKIYPAKEKSVQKQPGKKPETYQVEPDRGITFNFGGGKEMVLDKKGVVTIEANGKYSSQSLAKIEDEVLEKLMRVVPLEELINLKMPGEIIERMQKIKQEIGEKKRLVVASLIAKWNKYIELVQPELSVNLNQDIIKPQKELTNKTQAKQVLLRLLGKRAKVKPKELVKPIKNKVIDFLSKMAA